MPPRPHGVGVGFDSLGNTPADPEQWRRPHPHRTATSSPTRDGRESPRTSPYFCSDDRLRQACHAGPQSCGHGQRLIRRRAAPRDGLRTWAPSAAESWRRSPSAATAQLSLTSRSPMAGWRAGWREPGDRSTPTARHPTPRAEERGGSGLRRGVACEALDRLRRDQHGALALANRGPLRAQLILVAGGARQELEAPRAASRNDPRRPISSSPDFAFATPWA